MVYKGFSYIKSAVSDTADLARGTVGLQRVTGLDTQQAAGWVELAKEKEALQVSIAKPRVYFPQHRNIYSAAAGSKTVSASFEALGLDPMKVKAEGAKARMGDLADAIQETPTRYQ